MNEILNTSGTMDSKKKGRPHLGNAKTRRILCSLFQDSYMFKQVDDLILQINSKIKDDIQVVFLLSCYPLQVPKMGGVVQLPACAIKCWYTSFPAINLALQHFSVLFLLKSSQKFYLCFILLWFSSFLVYFSFEILHFLVFIIFSKCNFYYMLLLLVQVHAIFCIFCFVNYA